VFLTINGTGLTGAVSTAVSFTSPEDPPSTYTLEPSTIRPDGTRLVVFVPEVVTTIAGSWEVRVIATDTAGTRTIGPATLTVIDRNAGPPIITIPEFLFFPATSSEGAVVTYEASAVSASTGEEVPVDCTPASETQFSFGYTTVTCTATEGEFTSTARFLVLVWDFTAPVITVPDHHIMTDNPVVTYEQPTAVDIVDGAVPVVCNPASGSTFPHGTTTVLCTATDSRFNASAVTFTVTNTSGGAPPVITVPDDIVAEATSPAGAAVSYAQDASPPAVTCTPTSGSTFALGTTPVACLSTNGFGTSTASFNVTVIDSSGPALNPPDVTLQATSPAGAVGTFTIVGTDAVDGPIPAVCVLAGFDENTPPTPANGYLYPIGDTQVLCTASDSRDNVSFASFIVTVIDPDVTPPTVSVSVSPNSLWPPNHQMVDITVTVVASDDRDPSPVSQIVSVSSNQPINGTGDGDTGPDWEITGPLTLKLRAERSGGTERIYTITIETSDASGNVTTSTVEVKVPASRGKR